MKTIATRLVLNVKDSKLAVKETNDCVVRAVAVATDSHYDKAHAYVKEVFKRVSQRGTFTDANCPEGDFEMLSFTARKLGEKSYKSQYKSGLRHNTISKFIERNQKGTFICLVRKHAFVIKDGELIDNENLLHKTARKVKGVIKVS